MGWLRNFIAGLLLIISYSSIAQTKNVRTNYQVWLSANTVSRISKHWGALADFHIRRNEFLKDPSFFLSVLVHNIGWKIILLPHSVMRTCGMHRNLKIGKHTAMKTGYTSSFSTAISWIKQAYLSGCEMSKGKFRSCRLILSQGTFVKQTG